MHCFFFPQTKSQGVLEQENPQHHLGETPHFFKEKDKVKRQNWICSASPTEVVKKKEGLGPTSPSFKPRALAHRPGLSKASEGWLGTHPLSSHCHLQRIKKRSVQMGFGLHPAAQWTLSFVPSSDLLTLSRVINQPNGSPLPTLGIQIITTPQLRGTKSLLGGPPSPPLS